MTETGLQILTLGAALMVFSAFAAVQCGTDKPDETGDSAVTETGDTDPGGCIEETGDSERPPDSGESDPPDTQQPDTQPPDTSPPDTAPSDGCPGGMVSVNDAFCIDRFEASRPDASSSSPGVDDSYATSRLGVLPWKVSNQDEARDACEAAGKRLCTEDEWYTTCVGPDETVYSYGDDYEPTTCNGIDANCDCHGSTSEECLCEENGGPYAGCYYDCGGSYGRETTGSRSGCTNEFGVYDINGNLWEYLDSSAEYPVRGGAYNCGNSASYHQCSFVPGWNPSARGFRCCHDGEF